MRDSNGVGPFERFIGLVVLIGCLIGFGYLLAGDRIAGLIKPGVTYAAGEAPQSGEPNYPVTNREVPAWIHNCPVSTDAVQQVDNLLEKLRADHILEGILLCMPPGTVRDPNIYAQTFLKYMQLGLPDGPRADNGFVFLMIPGDSPRALYALGYGLPRLTAIGLTPILEEGEQAAKTGLDNGVITLATKLDQYARSKYEPHDPVAPQVNDYSKYAVVSNYNGNQIDAGKAGILLALIVLAALGLGTMLGSAECYELILFAFRVMASKSDNSDTGGNSSRRGSGSNSGAARNNG